MYARTITVEIETGKHGGPIVVARYTCGTVALGVKVEHAMDTVLGSVLDPSTVSNVRSLIAAQAR